MESCACFPSHAIHGLHFSLSLSPLCCLLCCCKPTRTRTPHRPLRALWLWKGGVPVRTRLCGGPVQEELRHSGARTCSPVLCDPPSSCASPPFLSCPSFFCLSLVARVPFFSSTYVVSHSILFPPLFVFRSISCAVPVSFSPFLSFLRSFPFLCGSIHDISRCSYILVPLLSPTPSARMA